MQDLNVYQSSIRIHFRDIVPVFQDFFLVRDCCRHMARHIIKSGPKPNIIAGLEARGFLFGPLVAIEMGLPFVPVRKKGKLPGATVSTRFVKEYGEVCRLND